MRQGSNGRRPRGRPHRKQQEHGGAPRHNSFDSNGPEGRIRGKAHQVYERYLALARDALSSGDRISVETHFSTPSTISVSSTPAPTHGRTARASPAGRAAMVRPSLLGSAWTTAPEKVDRRLLPAPGRWAVTRFQPTCRPPNGGCEADLAAIRLAVPQTSSRSARSIRGRRGPL